MQWTDAAGSWTVVGGGGAGTPAPANLSGTSAKVTISPDPFGDDHRSFVVTTAVMPDSVSQFQLGQRTDVNAGTLTNYNASN